MSTITSETAAVERLRRTMHGAVLSPSDAGYDEARRIWNGMIDRRPALIARCESEADVAAAVAHARERELPISVRGGGHSLPGHSVNDGGMMIDLQPMKRIEVNAQQRTVRAQPGVLWGEFDRATQTHGLAVTGGQISHTGIAGLTLGGGLGWLMRKYGLTCDNLIRADVVTADGRVVRASADENPELFWGLRGGGGNFGIVTEFAYRLHPVKAIYGGLLAFPLPAGKQVLQVLRDYLPTIPDELTTTVVLLTTPDGHKALGVGLCYCGDPAGAEKWVAPIRQMGPVVMEQLGPMPYTAVQSMMDHAGVPGRRYYLKSNFVDTLPDAAIDVLIAGYAGTPSPLTSVLLVQMGGAVARVATDATAFYHRHVPMSFSAFACWIDPAEDAANIGWARELWKDLQPYIPAAAYVNELVDEGEERVSEAYGPSYDRLRSLKRKYDPENVFKLNQNIRPA
jgi:FAD/FMN-containing dehydrogenase